MNLNDRIDLATIGKLVGMVTKDCKHYRLLVHPESVLGKTIADNPGATRIELASGHVAILLENGDWDIEHP